MAAETQASADTYSLVIHFVVSSRHRRSAITRKVRSAYQHRAARSDGIRARSHVRRRTVGGTGACKAVLGTAFARVIGFINRIAAVVT